MFPLFESLTLDPLVLTGLNPTGLDLSLSISLHPVPGCLVQLICLGCFVEMKNLLYENSTLRGHYEGLHGSTGFQLLPESSRPRVHEVTALSSWICCYFTYCAAQAPDQATRDRMTYAILVVREAMHHGGQGWLNYDKLFCQQAAINPGLQWNVIHPQLQETTVLNQCPQPRVTFAHSARSVTTPPCSVLLPRYSSHQAEVASAHTDHRANSHLEYVQRGTTWCAYCLRLAIIGTYA